MILLCILIISSVVLSQNFIYNDEDWIIISNPGQINSMTVRHDEILFTSINGVYSYNDNTQSLSYMSEFIRNFESKKNRIIHYDSYRDHMWYVNEKKIFFKPNISSIWRELEFYDLNVLNASDIKNIGSNSDYIFIKTDIEIIVLYPYTGNVITYEEHQIEYSVLNDIYINWSSTRYDDFIIQIDLKRFSSFNDYNIISNDYMEYNGSFIRITNVIKDSNNILWIGTDRGDLFKCDLYSNSIDKVKNIPSASNINNAYYDNYGEWWISIKEEIFMYNEPYLLNKDLFLLHWDENNNVWSYLHNDFNVKINSSDITLLFRSMNNLYVGTNQGLLKYIINKEEWSHFTNNSFDYYVYDILKFNNLIYVATNKGLMIISDNNEYQIDENIFDIFGDTIIADLDVIDNRLYIASEIGLFEYNSEDSSLLKISDELYSKIITDKEHHLYAMKKNRLFKIDNEGINYLNNIKNVKNICYCDNFIWFNNYKYASILNLSNNFLTEYNELDGLLSKNINNIQCDKNWVWFSTDNGLVLYNWSNYHYNE